MKKVVVLVVSVCLVLALLVGCTQPTVPVDDAQSKQSASQEVTETGQEGGQPAEAADKKSGDKVKVGLSIYDLANPYFVTLTNGAKAKAEELGIELIVDDPKSDSAKQVTALENFIAMGVDAIIVAPLDPEACESIVQKAMDQGIKVISQSSKTKSHNVYVSADEYDMGYVCGSGAGQWIVDKFGADAKIKCAVFGNDKIPTQVLRGDGMEDGIKELVPNAEIVRQDADTPTLGQQVADSVLQANPDMQVIVCLNDAGAIGAYSAIEAAGKDSDEFYLGSIDATEQALDLIKKGKCYRATVDLIPFENGGIDVELAVKLVNGEEVPETYTIPAKLVKQAELLG